MLKYLILGLLRDGKAQYGYALMKHYRDAVGVKLSVGNVYRELQNLVGLRWIQSAPNPPGSDERRVGYVITKQGISALDAWLVTPVAGPVGGGLDELTLRAFLISRVVRDLAPAVLEHWKDDLALCRSVLRREAGEVRVRGSQRSPARGSMIEALRVRRLGHIMIDLEFVEHMSSCSSREIELVERGGNGSSTIRRGADIR